MVHANKKRGFPALYPPASAAAAGDEIPKSPVFRHFSAIPDLFF
jgi:hypothetical protein